MPTSALTSDAQPPLAGAAPEPVTPVTAAMAEAETDACLTRVCGALAGVGLLNLWVTRDADAQYVTLTASVADRVRALMVVRRIAHMGGRATPRRMVRHGRMTRINVLIRFQRARP